MNLKAVVICLSVLMVGCSQTPPSVQIERLHPSWPDPISSWNGKWQVEIVNGEPWVGMPYKESNEFRMWLNDVSRYVQDQKGMICYYRTELKEPKCVN